MKDTLKQFKVTAIVAVVVLAMIFGIYTIGVGIGRTRQQKDMEDLIFKACAVTADDTTTMTIGDVRYRISIEH